MNYLQIRLKFRELSGRFDLVTDTGIDTGAGFFINEGRKFLDRLDETQKSLATCFRFLNVGSHSVQFPYCRAVKEVWVANPNHRWSLGKIDIQENIRGHMLSQHKSGCPNYYSPCITRYIPENQPANLFESFLGYVDIPAGNAHEYNTILVNAPTSEKLSVQINGLFYSAELVNDTDENYWSAAHPMLLYMAAMRLIEIANRNTQGVKDWEGSIGADVKTLGFDLIEEDIAGSNQMGG